MPRARFALNSDLSLGLERRAPRHIRAHAAAGQCKTSAKTDGLVSAAHSLT
jgi:hypothetical protein